MDLSAYYLPQTQKSDYYDKRSQLPRDKYFKKLSESNTLYVGSIPNGTSDSFLYELFLKVAPIKNMKIGVNKRNFNFCGFCFVEYFTREDAKKAIEMLNNFTVGDRRITIDFDLGFHEGREYGRGRRGGQAEEEKKNDAKRGDHFKGEFKSKFDQSNKRVKYE